MNNTNMRLKLQQAFDRKLISEEQYNRGISKLLTPSQKQSSLSLREKLDLALNRGLIKDDDHQKGLKNLEAQEHQENTREEKPTDPYSLRRAEALKKVESLPKFAKDIYGEYLYPERKKLEEEQRGIAKSTRNIATLPGAVADLPALIGNLPLALAGKQTYVPSQMIGEAIDTATSGYTKPETNAEKVNEAIMQSVLPMGAVGKIGNILARQGSKWINKPGKFLQSSNALNPTNVAATTAGAAGTQQYMNENPEADPFETLGVGVLSSLAGGKLGKNIDLLSNPSAGASRILGVNPNKVTNQLLDNQTGKYIPSTLADISDSEGIKLAQHALGKTPFLGNIVKNARDRGIEAEKRQLSKMGFGNALPSEEAGELSVKGVRKLKDNVGNEVSRGEKLIEEGLKPYAAPYPFKKPTIEDLERLERRKYNEQFQRKAQKKNVEKDKVDYKNQKEKGRESKQIAIIEHYTGKTADQLKNEQINLVPYNNTKKIIANKFNQHDMTKSQLKEFNNSFGKITEELDDLATVYQRKGIPIKSFNGVRKSIDDSITTFGEAGNVTQGKLKQLRNSIQKDIRNYLESKNPELAKAWDEKNKKYTNYKKVDEPHVNTINKLAESGDLEGVTKSLKSNMKNAGRKIVTVAKGLNQKEKEKLGFSLMSELGKETVDSDFDLFKFGKNYKRVQGGGKQAFKDLFSPEQAKSIDRLGRRMKDIQEASSLATQSPTGYINKFYHTVRHPIKSIGGTVGSAAILGIYTNPKFLNWLSHGSHIRSELKMGNHIQKLKKMDLGSQVINQELRDLYNRLEKDEGQEYKKKILHLTPQKDKESKAEFKE